jgi:ABC-type sugar transport system permease subunit
MMKKVKKKDYWGWYLLILVPITGTVVFNIYPLVQTFVDSFHNMKGLFIGMVNYRIMFGDPVFVQSFVNTLFMALLGVGFNIPIAFVVANMLNLLPRGKGFFKVVFLLPMIMSMVTVAILFKFLMMPDESGIFNFIRSLFGLGTVGFLNDPSMARQSLVVMAIWKGVGYNIIIFFAGLQAVPRELYEAARIDGANEWKQWISITIPSMKNSFIFVLITSTISALKRFTDVYAVSGETGNPAGALNTLMLYIYKNSFSTLNYKNLGLATAASIILFVVIMFFTLLNFFVTRDHEAAKAKRVAASLKRRSRFNG